MSKAVDPLVLERVSLTLPSAAGPVEILRGLDVRVGHEVRFDGKSETFVNDNKADGLLTREYRKGFEIPKLT